MSGESALLVEALSRTEAWDVPHASAAVVEPTGASTSVGDVDRTFALASVTKLLLATACLVAVEEETLDLDAPAGPPGSTVRHLLAHAAGYGFEGGVVAAPGKRRTYSNTGFEVLADHLAGRAGMDAASYVETAVLEPLAMTATNVRAGTLAAGATSTTADLARLAQELLAPSLVDPATMAAATTVTFPGLDGVLPGFGTQRPNDWGLGFEVRGHKSPHWTGSTNSASTVGHFGAAGTFLWIDPVAAVALVVLTDRPFGAWAAETWPPLADAVLAVGHRSKVGVPSKRSR